MKGLRMRKFDVVISTYPEKKSEIIHADRFDIVITRVTEQYATKSAYFYVGGELTDYFRDPYSVIEVPTPATPVSKAGAGL